MAVISKVHRGATRTLLPRGLSWQSGINMPIFVIAWLMAAVLIAASPVHAQSYFYTGNDLKEWVDAYDRWTSGNASRKDTFYVGILSGYLAGVYDSSGYISFCSPAGATIQQAIGIPKNYLEDNPDKWGYPATDLVTTSAKAAYACARRPP
jgi:hypothetical protein